MDRVLQIGSGSVFTVRSVSIFLVWLFHLTSVIGVSLGFEDWFITKTPLHLMAMTILLVLVFPIDSSKKAYLFSAFFLAGMLVEWTGVHSGVLFGAYQYGENLGLKLDGIPLLIGANWAILTFITAAISSALLRSRISRAAVGAGLMVFLDLFIETAAPRLDYWAFEGGLAPFQNYVMWFIVAFILQYAYQRSGIKGDLRFSLHLYAAQLFFFLYFHGITTL